MANIYTIRTMHSPLSRAKTTSISLILLAIALITPGIRAQAHGSQGYATDVYYRITNNKTFVTLNDHREKLKVGQVIHILSYDEHRKLFVFHINRYPGYISQADLFDADYLGFHHPIWSNKKATRMPIWGTFTTGCFSGNNSAYWDLAVPAPSSEKKLGSDRRRRVHGEMYSLRILSHKASTTAFPSS